jgi:hypothetical protein
VAFRPRLTPGLAFFLGNNYIAGAINMSRHFLNNYIHFYLYSVLLMGLVGKILIWFGYLAGRFSYRRPSGCGKTEQPPELSF